METSKRYYGVNLGPKEFICQILDDENVVRVVTHEKFDGMKVEYVQAIGADFVTLINVFVESRAADGQTPELQRLNDVILSVNKAHIQMISVMPEEAVKKLRAAVSGIIV